MLNDGTQPSVQNRASSGTRSLISSPFHQASFVGVSKILKVGADLQMIRVGALLVIATVHDAHALWNLALK